MLFLAALIGGWGVFALHTTLGFGGASGEQLFQDVIYNMLMLGASLAVLARGVFLREDRVAWLAMGTGLLSWSLGELYYSLLIEGTSREAGGSVTFADVLFLGMYPCFYVALGLLARPRLRGMRMAMWLDGLIAGLAAASVGAALILPPILDSATGVHSSIVVSIAYPIGDLLLDDVRGRRAWHDRLASGKPVAADRREHARQRNRRLDLSLSDGHRLLRFGDVARMPVAACGDHARDRRLDALGARAPPRQHEGLADDVGAGARPAQRVGGARLRQSRLRGSRFRRWSSPPRPC